MLLRIQCEQGLIELEDAARGAMVGIGEVLAQIEVGHSFFAELCSSFADIARTLRDKPPNIEGAAVSALDLLHARVARVEHARPSWRYLRDNGVDFVATEPACGGAYLAPVKAVPPRSFDIDPDGDDAIVIEAFGEDSQCADLVSWRPNSPQRWRSMFGAAPALGMWAAVQPATYMENLPLQLFRTPLEWLQGQCDGAVLLDHENGARWLLSLDSIATTLAPRNDAHAAEIEAARLSLVTRQRLVVPIAPALMSEMA